MTVADRIAEFFQTSGWMHAFGIIGAGNIAIFDAVHRRGYTQLVSPHHEQAAAMAAAYYWRVSGRLAPVIPTTGGGSSNTLTGVIAAWQDSIPMLIVSGNEPTRFFKDRTRVIGVQGYHSHDIPWVNWSCRVEDPVEIPGVLTFAVKRATEGRPGPVWVDVPRDIQTKEAP